MAKNKSRKYRKSRGDGEAIGKATGNKLLLAKLVEITIRQPLGFLVDITNEFAGLQAFSGLEDDLTTFQHPR